MAIITTLQDLTYLEWTKTRHSSGTAGSFLKAYENRRGKKLYYKLSNYESGSGIVGHECVNEIVADRLLTKMGIEHLSYDLVHARILLRGEVVETWLCRSVDFKTDEESKIALDTLYDMEAMPGEKVHDFCLRMGFGEYLWEMLTIDFLLLNRDRHGANIEVLKNRRTKSLRPAPLFDHGLSMLFSGHEEEAWLHTDPRDDRKVQCFVGTFSTWENLKLIPDDKRRQLPVFDENLKSDLFADMQGIMGKTWMNCVWNFLKVRAKMYEDFCNPK